MMRQFKKKSLITGGIAGLVFLFNQVAVWKPNYLLHDDPARYGAVNWGYFPYSWIKYNLILPFTEWISWHVMVISPYLERELYIILFLIPISIMLYRLYCHAFGFSRITAMTAALLPAILPMQTEIPSGINMSYVVWGFFFIVISMVTGVAYLESQNSNRIRWCCASWAAYLMATQIMEIAVFMSPPLVMLWLSKRKVGSGNLYLGLGFIGIGLIKLVQMIIFPRKSFQLNPLEIIIDRIAVFATWIMPLPNIFGYAALAVGIGIIMAACVIRRQRSAVNPVSVLFFSGYSSWNQEQFRFIFFALWVISSILPAILLSYVFTLRYGFIAAYGAIPLLLLSIEIIIDRWLPRSSIIIPLFFSALILVSGISRFSYINHYHIEKNRAFNIISRDLRQKEFPGNSQIVITTIDPGFPIGWYRSSGQLQYMTKRKDITGLLVSKKMDDYTRFVDHFDPSLRGCEQRYAATGLTLNQPLFMFNYDSSLSRLIPLYYVLQWRSPTIDVPWTIFRCDSISGKIDSLVSGKGIKDYQVVLEKLKALGIDQRDILWGMVTESELKRRQEVNQ